MKTGILENTITDISSFGVDFTKELELLDSLILLQKRIKKREGLNHAVMGGILKKTPNVDIKKLKNMIDSAEWF